MLGRALAMFLLVLSLLAWGCARAGQPGTTETSRTSPEAAPPSDDGDLEDLEPPVPIDLCGEKVPPIGVPACDEYATTYASCISTKMPEHERPAMCLSLRSSMTAWRERASTDQGRAAIIESCRRGHETTKKFCAQPVAAAVPAVDSIGVPDCDIYIARFTACIHDKLPEAARESSLQALEATKKAWREALAQGMDPTAIAQACRTATEAVAQACK